MPAKGGARQWDDARLGHRAGARAPPRARAARHRAPLGEPRRLAARARRGRGTSCPRSRFPRPSSRSSLGCVIGNLMLARRGGDRSAGARARDGAAARAARPARLVCDRPCQRRRSASAGRCSSCSSSPRPPRRSPTSSSASRAQWLWTLALRRARAGARPARAGRRRAAVRPHVRGVGGARLAALPHVVGARRVRARQPLGPARRGRLVRAGRAPTSSSRHGLLDPACRRLHALLAARPRGAFWARASATCSRASGSGSSGRSSSSHATSPTRPRCPWRSRPAGRARSSRCSRSPSPRPTRRSRTPTRAPSRSRTWHPALPQRALVVAVAVVATLGALTIDLLSYQTFLLLLGSFFVPLFGVLLADWLVAGAHYGNRTSSRRLPGGPA